MTSDLVLTAIDVLAASIFGEPVEPRLINKIRRHSVSNQDWPIAELCRLIIQSELAMSTATAPKRI